MGVAFCQSELFWIFNLEYSSLNIDLVFGDFICARLTGGSKYMLHAKATSYLDFGKTQLVEVLAWDKTKTETPLLIGRVISLADLDKLLFTDTLIEENQLDVRSYRQALVDEKKENFFPTAFSWKKIDGAYGKKFLSVVENLKKFYFEKSLDYGNFLREVSIQLG